MAIRRIWLSGVLAAGAATIAAGAFGHDALAAEPFPASIELMDLDAETGRRFDGLKNGDSTGAVVAPAGDVNGDGVDDILILAPSALRKGYKYGGRGSVYVVFGRKSDLPPSFTLADLNGRDGFRIDGMPAPDTGSEISSVASAGDINGDGFDDIMINTEGTVPDRPPGTGAVYVIYGRSSRFPAVLKLASFDRDAGFRLDGAAEDSGGTDSSIASAGDVNGDGFDDMLIGMLSADPRGRRDAGLVYVVFGRAARFPFTTRLSGLDASQGFRLLGPTERDAAGWTVAPAGDVNDDGLADLAILAVGTDPDGKTGRGSVFVLLGRKSGFSRSLELSQLDGSNGFRIDGEFGQRTGRLFDVASAGDVNGDGSADIVIAAHTNHPDDEGRNVYGSTYVVFGKSSGFAAILNLASLDGTNGFRIDSLPKPTRRQYFYSGLNAASAGDVNDDGFDDILTSAESNIEYPHIHRGLAYVIFGKASGFAAVQSLSSIDREAGFRVTDNEQNSRAGQSLGPAGDFNGDGIDDFLIGAPAYQSSRPPNPGRTFVVFGRHVE